MMPSTDIIVLLIIALCNAFTAFLSYKTHQNIKTLETNTNSVKDALVKVTEESAHARGVLMGRAQQHQEEKDKRL